MTRDALDRNRWNGLCERVGCPAASRRFEEIEGAYAERHRRYHTVRHIEECLSLFDGLRHLCARPDEVELAIWLHDVVYRPRRTDNEERSAALAREWLEECGVDAAAVSRVHGLVMATRHDGEPGTADERIILDVDLHILGAAPERFDEYEAQVRAEYRWVPSPIFRQRRADILRGFLEREPLFFTAECRSRFEERARSNLRRSVERLTGRDP